MPFSPMGFVVGTLVARQAKLPQSTTITVGAVTSAMGGLNAMGIVVAEVLTRNAVASLPPKPPPPPPGGGSSTFAPRLLGSTGSGGGTTSSAPLLDPPALVTPTIFVDSAGEKFINLNWEKVKHAAGYRVSRVHKGETHFLATTTSTRFVDPLPASAKPDSYRYEVASVNADGAHGTGVMVSV